MSNISRGRNLQPEVLPGESGTPATNSLGQHGELKTKREKREQMNDGVPHPNTEFEAQRQGESRLSRIETLWSVVRRAHEAGDSDAVRAQERLLRRYDGAIRRYLLAAVRNQDLANELFQEFALRLINGDFKSADPEKGRFRSFVKTILFRMVADYYRKRGRSKEIAIDDQDYAGLATDSNRPESEMNELFLTSWREEVLNQTWDALADYEANGGGPYHSVLRTRVENPSLSSEELAAVIKQVTGKETTAGSARVMVHRSRDKFAQLLIDLVANSLEDASVDEVEQELVDLRLIDYCRDVLAARRSEQ